MFNEEIGYVKAYLVTAEAHAMNRRFDLALEEWNKARSHYQAAAQVNDTPPDSEETKQSVHAELMRVRGMIEAG